MIAFNAWKMKYNRFIWPSVCIRTSDLDDSNVDIYVYVWNRVLVWHFWKKDSGTSAGSKGLYRKAF